MKKYIGLFVLLMLFCVSVSAQKITKPTLTPKESTPAQAAVINEGVKLFDAGKYDDAIVKFEQVLKENPDNTIALYELALTYYKKKDFAKFTDVATVGIKYKSNQLPQFYEMIGSLLDDLGKPQEAIQVYKDAVKILEEQKEYQTSLASIHFNMGVTYFRQKMYKEAREVLKKSVEANFRHPSANYLLAVIYNGTGYKIPGLLAAARFVTLEIQTQRSQSAAKIFVDGVKGNATKNANGDINIMLNMGGPTDEGDFGAADMVLSMSSAIDQTKEKAEKDEKPKTEEEKFAERIDMLIAFIGSDKEIKKTFVGRTYAPFMNELKARKYSQIFAYLILQQNGNKTAEKWLIDNSEKAVEFINWARSYQPAK